MVPSFHSAIREAVQRGRVQPRVWREPRVRWQPRRLRGQVRGQPLRQRRTLRQQQVRLRERVQQARRVRQRVQQARRVRKRLQPARGVRQRLQQARVRQRLRRRIRLQQARIRVLRIITQVQVQKCLAILLTTYKHCLCKSSFLMSSCHVNVMVTTSAYGAVSNVQTQGALSKHSFHPPPSF